MESKIELIDDTIFAEPTQIYQVRFPGQDIRIRVKNLSTVNFSEFIYSFMKLFYYINNKFIYNLAFFM